jgi:hypothetical protein
MSSEFKESALNYMKKCQILNEGDKIIDLTIMQNSHIEDKLDSVLDELKISSSDNDYVKLKNLKTKDNYS